MTHTMVALQVGDRLEDASGSRGTVRYIGPVASSKDLSTVYYGIEWDEWGRGLNDGSVTLADGTRHVYFDGPKPRVSSTSAPQFKCSFVKQSKLSSVERCSLVDALCDRYGTKDDDDAIHNQSHNHGDDVVVTGEVSTLLGQNKPIQLVGVHKLRQQQTLESISKVSLSGARIACIDSDSELLAASSSMESDRHLSQLTPNLFELDLANNLLTRWNQVLNLLQQLPKLHTLVLSGNRLALTHEDDLQEQLVHPTLKVLVLNQTLLPLDKVFGLVSRHFPHLQELHVAANEYTDDELRVLTKLSPSQSLASLETLDLSGNCLSDWSLVCRTLQSVTPQLCQLVLNDNRMSSLVIHDHNYQLDHLRSLSLNDNLVDSWSSIDALNAFGALDTLRFNRNPLTNQMGPGEARTLLVARLARLQVFNGSDVRVKERRDAEQLYLKRILFELAACNEDATDQRDGVLATHPRFQALQQAYPELELALRSGGATPGTAGPSALASSLIGITIVPMSMQATTLTPLEKKIPEKMKLAQLKILIQNRFGIAANDQLLSFRSDPKSMPIPLENDVCEMGYFGIQDGAEILVNDA